MHLWWLLAVVALAAIVMGAPSINGGFVGGDDHQLVLNHVLVNHPSLSHAIELFRIVHRDLYQPLPLLSFQFEFLIANSLGLFDESIRGGAWLFHLTNVLLHAVNAVLVCVLIHGLHANEKRRSTFLIAGTAALVFAIHPLQSEVVAWINGRMMLLSTLFGLAALIAFDRWLTGSRWKWAAWALVFVLLSAISKIRIGLPFLMFGVAYLRRAHLNRRCIVVWAIGAVITGIFVAINWEATEEAGMFSGAAEQLHGPRLARTVVALAWYFQHFLWPTGLASWYPTPLVIHWSDALVVRSILLVALCAGVAIFTIWLRRRSAFGWMWIAFTIASTLPLVPARNALAADRYVYFPIVGLAWIVALMVQAAFEAIQRSAHRQGAVHAGRIVVAALVSVLFGLSWHTISFYRTPVTKTERIAQLFPDTPYVWGHVAGAYYDRGDYKKAIELASRELDHDDAKAQSRAMSIIGKAQFSLGQHERGLASMREAVRIDPKNARAKYYLGRSLMELGRTDEAIQSVEASVELAPRTNPWLIRLATLYREVGRREEARTLYDRCIANNPFEVPAHMGLVEMAIEDGTREGLSDARHRLGELLAWKPEDADAWTNLGVVASALGDERGAVTAYKNALHNNPQHGTAALNLSTIYMQAGDTAKAKDYLDLALADPQLRLENPFALHDALMAQGRGDDALNLWSDLVRGDPESPSGRVMVEWTRMQLGRAADVATVARYAAEDEPEPMAVATSAYAALVDRRYDDAAQQVDRLCDLPGDDRTALRRLMGALERYDARTPGQPRVFCLTARLLLGEGLTKEASLAVDLCEAQCRDDSCASAVAALRARLVMESN